jgi:hypothetical protein
MALIMLRNSRLAPIAKEIECGNAAKVDDLIMTEKEIFTSDDIEMLYAVAIIANNVMAISRLNLYVDEYDIKIKKINLIRKVHSVDWCLACSKGKSASGLAIKFNDYDGKIDTRLLINHWHLYM